MTRRRIVRTVLQLVLLACVVWYLRDWRIYRHALSEAHPDWGAILASSFFVLVAYILLIQTWRQVVEAWGERLDFGAAMRIWFVSNLGKYIPGKYWSIAAMGALAQVEGVSAVAAVGSSLVVQLVNLVTGFGVFFVCGAQALHISAGAIAAVIVLGALLVGAPWLLPWAIRLVNRITGRDIAVPLLPPQAIWWAAAGTTLAWVFYGIAFDFFAYGMAGDTIHGSIVDWTAVFVGPYLVGFITFFAPGGIGAREMAMATALQRTGLAVGAVSALLVVASRVWLTVLELVPGLLFLLVRPLDRTNSPSSR